MAGNNVGKWSATAGLDASGFSTGTDKMIADTKRATTAVATMGQNMRGVFASFSTGFGTIVGPAGGITGVMALAQGAMSRFSQVMESSLNLSFLNDRLGTSIEFLSSFETVARETSITSEQFANAMERMEAQLGEAARGAPEAIRLFERLGVTWERLRVMSGDQQILEIFGALSALPRERQADVARDLFGRQAGARMQRLATEGLHGRILEAAGRGGAITPEMDRNFRRADDAIDTTQTRSAGLWRRIWGGISEGVAGIFEDVNRFDAGLGRLMQGAQLRPLPLATGADAGALVQSMEDRANRARARRNSFLEEHRELTAERATLSFGTQRHIEVSSRLRALNNLIPQAERELELATQNSVQGARRLLEATKTKATLWQKMAEAQDAAARAGKARLVAAQSTERDRMVAEAVLPGERLADRMRAITNSGLKPGQQAAMFGQLFSGMLGGQASALGSLSAGGEDVARALQDTQSQQVDELAEINDHLEAMRRNDERMLAIGERVLNELVGQQPVFVK